MKKITLLTFPFFLFASQVEINQNILDLEKELHKLQKEVQYHQEDLDERSPIIEAVEKKSILDKINFSPEVLLRFDKFEYDNNGIEGEDTRVYENGTRTPTQRRDEFSKNFDIATSVRFRLNMNMQLDDIKFYGRLLYMTSSQSNERVCILSQDIKTGTPGSAFDVDRAYIDYTLNPKSEYPFTFSFGILPTTGGTPMQFAQDKKRSSLFPALVFDMNTYGMIGTQKIAEDTYVRAVLAKGYTLRANFYPYQCNRENINNANIFGLYADTKFHFLGSALLSFGVNVMHDLKAHPYLGPDVTADNSDVLGSMMTLGLGIDIEQIADTPTAVFLHTALSSPNDNGKTDDYKIYNWSDTYAGDEGFTESDYATGTMLQESGYSIYLGVKYHINPAVYLGAEFNHGSKYWFSATQGAEDIYNKLATRGEVYDIYSAWKFHKYLGAKLSYLRIEESYTGAGWHFGEPAKKDATQNIISLALEAKF
jgi:hypothetical protein